MSQEKVDWSKKLLPALKEELKKRGLTQIGNKAELVARLEQADQEAAASVETPAEEEAFEVVPVEDDENMEGDAGNEDEAEGGAGGEEGGEEHPEGKEGEEEANGAEATEGVEEVAGEGEGVEKAEEGGTQEGEGKDQGPTEEDKYKEIEAQFYIDMPRERDHMLMTWHGKKFTVPFGADIHTDLAAQCSQRSITVQGVDLDDIKSEVFQGLVDKSLKFSFDFFERSTGKTTTGLARFVFGSVEEATQVKEELAAYKDSLKIEPLKFDYRESEEDIAPANAKRTTSETRPTVQRLLYVGNLPNDVAEPTLREIFPDALRVIIPHSGKEENAENSEQTRYAYVEYASEEEVVKAAEEHKDKMLNEEKLFVIRAIAVRKERFGLLSNTLRFILIDKTRKLKRIVKNPYNKSTFEIKEIEKSITQNMEKLEKDGAHREAWGMEMGRLDISKVDEEEPASTAAGQRGRGGPRGGGSRGTGRGGPRGGYLGQGAPRGGRGGSSWVSPSPRGGYGGGYGGYSGGAAGGYGGGGYYNQQYNAGGYGGGGYNAGGYGGYAGGYNQGGGYKRRAEDNGRGGDWKRARGGRGRGYY